MAVPDESCLGSKKGSTSMEERVPRRHIHSLSGSTLWVVAVAGIVV